MRCRERFTRRMSPALLRFICALAVLALGLAASSAAGPPGECQPWPECRKDEGGAGTPSTPWAVAVVGHEYSSFDPLWAPADDDPDCLAEKGPGKHLHAVFPRHDLCATLTTSTGAGLADDIVVWVRTDNKGQVDEIMVDGQDMDGMAGMYHRSDVMTRGEDEPPFEMETRADGSFVIHVHADGVRLWGCDTHIEKKQSVCDQDDGFFAIDDLTYFPDPL